VNRYDYLAWAEQHPLVITFFAGLLFGVILGAIL
jgi:uncharacterized integral membrane protein